jgi:hypothetical protein
MNNLALDLCGTSRAYTDCYGNAGASEIIYMMIYVIGFGCWQGLEITGCMEMAHLNQRFRKETMTVKQLDQPIAADIRILRLHIILMALSSTFVSVAFRFCPMYSSKFYSARQIRCRQNQDRSSTLCHRCFRAWKLP